jgi:ribosome-binding factor A
MPGRKLEHLNSRIQQKLGVLLQREAADPRFERVTIVSVNLSRDMAHAGVKFSCYNKNTDVPALTESLNKAAGFLGKALARTMETRKSPKLHFTYDPGFDYAEEMEGLLKQVRPAEEPPP